MRDGDAPAFEVPLLVSAELGVHLPLGIATDALEGRVVRGPEAVVRVTLQRPLGAARGRYQQHQLRSRARPTPGSPAGC